MATQTSPLQIIANRANAQASTGPRTPEGRERVSQNACTHRLFAQDPVLPHEDRSAYEALQLQFKESRKPKGALEEQLVQTLASLQWRLNRCLHIEACILEDESLSTMEQLDALAKYSLYEGRLRRSFQSTLKQLCDMQSDRIKSEKPELIDAVLISEYCKESQIPFDPAEIGFDFSIGEIDAATRRQALLLQATNEEPASPDSTDFDIIALASQLGIDSLMERK